MRTNDVRTSAMPRWMLAIAAFAALVYVALCVALYTMQRSLIYFPQAGSAAQGSGTLVLNMADAKVRVTTHIAAGPNAVIYFGGNAEDVSLSFPLLRATFPDDALYLLHYRGYGGSTGSPSESAIVADAIALFDIVHSEHRHVVIVGRSLGSGVAAQLASVRPAQRLVLITPYDSLQEIAATRFPFFPVRWLLRDEFESGRYVADIAAPVLIVAAEHDGVIPRASTESLYRRFRPGAATMSVVRGADHNTISDSADYASLLKGSP